MSRQPGLSEWIDLVSTHMPHLSVPQARVLALWSYGIALTRSCGRLTVATLLALLMGQKVATVAQRLYEWCCDTSHKAGAKRQTLDVTTCFAPLLCWIVTLWTGTHLALALDATSLAPGDGNGCACCGACVLPSHRTGRCWCWRTAVCGRAGSLGALCVWAGIRCCGSTTEPSSVLLARHSGMGSARWSAT